jgi:thiamine-monophosphate kinase
MDDEQKLIERIRRAIPAPRGAGVPRDLLPLGIGDDAAVLRPSPHCDLVLSCDAFLEGIHFIVSLHPPDSVGYKSLARATSDLAAMGARPRYFLMSLALPSERTGRWLDRFLFGMWRAARALGIQLAGGDTSRYPTVVINITVVGEVARGRAVLRSGARPGDQIYVTGRLGAAQLGLELVPSGLGRRKDLRHLLAPHLYPRIPLALGQWLSRRRAASAMIDISDGLSTDLARLCQASGVGARVVSASIPTVRVPAALRDHGLDPLQMALHGGDDYGLLFTVPPHLAEGLRQAPNPGELCRIGEITQERQIVLVGTDGRAQPLPAMGWDSFRKPRRGAGR